MTSYSCAADIAFICFTILPAVPVVVYEERSVDHGSPALPAPFNLLPIVSDVLKSDATAFQTPATISFTVAVD